MSRRTLGTLATLLCGAIRAAGAQPVGRVVAPHAPGTVDVASPAADAFAGPLGLQLYSVRGAMRGDVPGTLARVRALGFHEVELAGTYGRSAAEFRRMLDAAGLRATSMHVGYERLRDSLPAVLADARTLGTRNIGVAWIPHPNGPMTVQLARATAAEFGRWGQAARAAGLQFFYHVHGYEFQPDSDGVVPIDVLMHETDPAAVTFEMDVFWTALPGADPVTLLQRYRGRWRLMHLKDMRRGVVRNVQSGGANPDSAEVPVGTGQLDYRAVLRAAKAEGVERYYIEDETADPFATIPRSTRWLQTVRY